MPKDLCKNANEWRDLGEFAEQFLPDCWKHPPEAVAKAGHAGSDFYEVTDFVNAIAEGREPPIGIHDSRDMTLPGLISQESIRRDGEWLPVPDSREW
jgi:hypothetical protein